MQSWQREEFMKFVKDEIYIDHLTILQANVKSKNMLRQKNIKVDFLKDLVNFWPKIFAKNWLSAFKVNLAFWCKKYKNV